MLSWGYILILGKVQLHIVNPRSEKTEFLVCDLGLLIKFVHPLLAVLALLKNTNKQKKLQMKGDILFIVLTCDSKSQCSHM